MPYCEFLGYSKKILRVLQNFDSLQEKRKRSHPEVFRKMSVLKNFQKTCNKSDVGISLLIK